MLLRSPVPSSWVSRRNKQHVVGDTQVDVVDALVDEADAVVAPLRHPAVDIAVGHPLAPADHQRLAEPILRHADEDRAERDEAEHDELGLEARPSCALRAR